MDISIFSCDDENKVTPNEYDHIVKYIINLIFSEEERKNDLSPVMTDLWKIFKAFVLKFKFNKIMLVCIVWLLNELKEKLIYNFFNLDNLCYYLLICSIIMDKVLNDNIYHFKEILDLFLVKYDLSHAVDQEFKILYLLDFKVSPNLELINKLNKEIF